MADLNSYTVVDITDLPHCEEGEHEAFDRCPDCDPFKVPEATNEGMILVDAEQGFYMKCPTCKGTREGGPSLGMVPCPFPRARYMPGQTVKLSAEAAAPLLADGHIAPVAAENIEELVVRASAKRLGISL